MTFWQVAWACVVGNLMYAGVMNFMRAVAIEMKKIEKEGR